MKKSLTVKLPLELYEKLEEYCKRIGEAKSVVVREALRRFLEKA